jgi:hypothetical protein
VLVSVGSGLGALLLHRLDAPGAVVVMGQSACLIGVAALLEIAAIRRRPTEHRERPGVVPRAGTMAGPRLHAPPGHGFGRGHSGGEAP